MATPTDTADPRITELRIADDPHVWRDLGFEVDDNGTCRIGTVDLALTGSSSGRGITGWKWSGVAAADTHSDELFGTIETRFVDANADNDPAAPHPNTVVGMFYVVLFGPSHDAAAAAVRALGPEVSEPIRMGPPDAADEDVRLRSLAPAGGIEVEVIGPMQHNDEGKWRLWGVIIEVADIDALAERLGDRLRPIKPAVQRGRRIATLDKAAGSSVAIAFMSEVDG